MSYSIVRSISVRDGKVYLRSASNNVWPRNYDEWECKGLSQILQEKGRDALDIEILNEYEGGMMQGGSNKYTRALKVLRNMPEYAEFDWRANGEHYERNKENREKRVDEFRDLLLRALKTKLPKEKFVVTKQYNGETVFMLYRRRWHHCQWTRAKSEATKFPFEKEAKEVCSFFREGCLWSVVPA